jgi:hypothetical protein
MPEFVSLSSFLIGAEPLIVTHKSEEMFYCMKNRYDKREFLNCFRPAKKYGTGKSKSAETIIKLKKLKLIN